MFDLEATIEYSDKIWRLKLDKNENTYGCFDSVLSIIKNTLTEDITKYPDGEKFISKLSKKYEINKENILLTTSTRESFKLLKELCICDNENILKLNPFQNLSDLKEKITIKTKIIYINSPNNITGISLKASAIEELVKIYPNVFFVINCNYVNFSYKISFKDFIELPKKYHNIAIIKSFSKDYSLAGLKISFILSNEKIVKSLKRISPNSVNSIAINCASIVLNDEKKLIEIKELNQNAKELFIKELNMRNFKTTQSEANFVLCDFENYCEFYYKKLIKHDIITKNFFDNEMLSSYLRITVPTLGGVKYLCEILNQKEMLIFDSKSIIDKENKLLISEKELNKLSEKYDLIIHTDNYIKTEKIFKEYEISKYFYIQKNEEISDILKQIPYKTICYLSKDINNIIKANIAQIETIGILSNDVDCQNTINNFKHIGTKFILNDINELSSYLF